MRAPHASVSLVAVPVYTSFTRVDNGTRRYVREKELSVALMETLMEQGSYVRTCSCVYGCMVKFLFFVLAP